MKDRTTASVPAHAVVRSRVLSEQRARSDGDPRVSRRVSHPARQITIQMPGRGLPHLELGERVMAQNHSMDVRGDYWVVRHGMTCDGGLTAQLTCPGVS